MYSGFKSIGIGNVVVGFLFEVQILATGWTPLYSKLKKFTRLSTESVYPTLCRHMTVHTANTENWRQNFKAHLKPHRFNTDSDTHELEALL